MKAILIAVIIFLLTAIEASAQISVKSFNSNTTSDWVEIYSDSEQEIDFSEYLILDQAGNKLQKDYLIPPKGNCVFDFSNKLNNAGDIIYIQKDSQNIFCVKYGDGAGGSCDNISVSTESAKPPQNCFEPTPVPTSTPTSTPTPSPSSKPTSTTKPTLTPKPTVLLTSKPVSTLRPTIAPKPDILAASEQAVLEEKLQETNTQDTNNQDTKADNVIEDQTKQKDPAGAILIFVGSLLVFSGLTWTAFSVYNKIHK